MIKMATGKDYRKFAKENNLTAEGMKHRDTGNLREAKQGEVEKSLFIKKRAENPSIY